MSASARRSRRRSSRASCSTAATSSAWRCCARRTSSTSGSASLSARFHLHAVAVTAASASRLERELPPSESIFTAHPHTVVSLDYIKSDRRRERVPPRLSRVRDRRRGPHLRATGQGRHQRYELLKGLAESPTRHLVLLTATPHSGDEAAFFRLLGLLDRDFERLADATGRAARSPARAPGAPLRAASPAGHRRVEGGRACSRVAKRRS